jgi:glycosyltransferase involved in cell wall biosynthesis
VGEVRVSAGPGVELSVVIPVHNEEALLESSVVELCASLEALGVKFEILLAENGSRDATVARARVLSDTDPRVRWFSAPRPNYGGALREGILRATGRFVVCEEIDLCDADFHRRAYGLLAADEADFVVGSKAMRGAADRRPWLRRTATRVYNTSLRVLLGFHGTDTHGLKAFRREPVVPVAKACVVEFDVFASELVIRAERCGLRMREIPVAVDEKRAPSIGLLRRVPRVLRNLVRLFVAVRLGGTRDAGSRGE